MENVAGRLEAILGACDSLLNSYEEWAERESTIEPETVLADLLDHLTTVYQIGDIPGACRTVMEGMGRVVEEWRAFKSDGRQVRGAPVSSFHAAMRSLAETRAEVNQPKRKSCESVAQLQKEGLSHRQIAVAFGRHVPGVGGVQWSGPFWNPDGSLALARVEAEAENPGSVLTWDEQGNWVPPWEDEDRAKSAAAEATRLSRVRQRASEREASEGRRGHEPTAEEIINYMSTGGFAHQVPKNWPACRLSLDEIRGLAIKDGFEPASKDRPEPIDLETGEPLGKGGDPLMAPIDGFDADAYKARVVAVADDMGFFESEVKATDVDEQLRTLGEFDNSAFTSTRTAAVLRGERQRREKAEKAA